MSDRNPLTMSDIAKLAQVSESTVSRGLRNDPLVNEKTREKVQKIAREHNYQINESARNLRLRKSHTIAVVMLLDTESGQAISDPFLLGLLGNVADELSKVGYDLLLSTPLAQGDELTPNYLESKRADGMILIGEGDHGKNINSLAGSRKPFVVWGAYQPGQNYCTVGSDNKKGAYMAVKHLIDTGHRRIAFFGNSIYPEIEQRLEGYRQALTEAGLDLDEDLLITTAFSSRGGYAKTRDELLGKKQSFDAIFTVSDAIAMGAIKQLKEKNIRVPEDVAVSGYDDIPISAFCTPALTTIRQNTEEAGRHLVKCLMDQLAGKKAKSIILDTELIIRQSSGGQPDP
ncbi:MAG: LacI family transcriptional regulator [Alphaproteobacteria bacterium]|nr:MAG: LacI family transcriptional regulator [Alphaproteobacteria bacterium]